MPMDVPQIDLVDIVESGPYPMEAFDFVREGLSYTAGAVHGDEQDALPELERHVSGQQLCMGLRDFAIRRYGYMAPAVLAHWNVHRTDDFGRIVFSLIEGGYMSKTPDDTLDDFRGVFDFDEAFREDELLDHLRVD